MIEVEGWIILNFFTTFLLVLLLIFQSATSRLQQGRKYSLILICTLVLLLSETLGHIGESYPDKYIMLARIGYFMIFLLDPVDILFAVYYMDCWMDDENHKIRTIFRSAFELHAVINMVTVSISAIFKLKWFFYFENGVYYRGTFFLARALLMMFFIILLIVYAIAFRKNILSEYKNVVLFLPGFAFIGSLLQVFFANLDTTYAGISLGCLILFFTFQSRDVNVDYLTGVLNRRGLDIKMQDKVKNSNVNGKDFTAIMMDVDHFKDINDRLGHSAGDKAIKIIANVLEEIFGDNAYIGRFGGDEFCIIIDSTSKDELKEKIDKVHNSIAKVRRKHGWPEGVDVSCGYHCYEHSSGMSAKQFQELIDRLMYLEKQEHHKYS